MKAGGIFLLSLGIATALGLGLSATSPPSQCQFPVVLSVETSEGGLRATVTSVDGEFSIRDVEYQIVEVRGSSLVVLDRGNLTDALTGLQGVVYLPVDPLNGALDPGDQILVEEAVGDTHVFLATHEGIPLGWSAGC